MDQPTSLESQRDDLDRRIRSTHETRTKLLHQKLGLLEEAKNTLTIQHISESVIDAVGKAAADHFHAEHQKLLATVRGADEWDLLDSIDLPVCGSKAVEMARELGITDEAILGLVHDFGMRTADFCFIAEEQTLAV